MELLRLREWQHDWLSEKANVEGYGNGVECLRHGEYSEAMAAFSSCLRRRGLSQSAFTMLGIVYLELGELIKADENLPVADYDIADNEPRDDAVLFYQGLLAFALEDKGRIEEILGDWHYVGAEYHEYFKSIRTLLYEDRYSPADNKTETWRAVESHVRIICQFDGAPLQPLFAGRALLEFDCPEKAIDSLTVAIQNHSSLEEPWFLRSMAYRELGAADAAARDLESAEQVSPGISGEADRWWQDWHARLDRRRHPSHPWKSADGRIVIPEAFSTRVMSE